MYKIHQNILKIIQVYCDQTTDGTVVDGQYFNGELTVVSNSLLIGNTINKVSVIHKTSIG